MIKILIEGVTDNKGGKESYILNMFRAFDKSRFAFTFVAYDRDMVYREELLEAGAQVVDLPPRHAGLSAYRKALRQTLDEGGYDVVWAHKTTLSSCEILELAAKCKVPVRIVHSHSSSNMGGSFTLMMHRLNQRRIFGWANEFVACSDVAAKWFYRDHPARILKNGIDLEKFRFSPAIRERIRKQYGWDKAAADVPAAGSQTRGSDHDSCAEEHGGSRADECVSSRAEECGGRFVIGHVGRFGVEKNHMKLLSVFHAYLQRNPSAVLLLCGDGEERERIVSRIRELGIEDQVFMPGVVDNVHEYLQAMDVMVMPSLFEGLPFALLEAQAAGLGCVVSDTVSPESDVAGRNRRIGLNEPDEVWAEAIDTLAAEKYDRSKGYEVLKEQGFDIRDNVAEAVEMIEAHLRH